VNSVTSVCMCFVCWTSRSNWVNCQFQSW